MDETKNAHKFLSHIIFAKFSQELRQAFVWELDTDYPTFKQILNSYCKVITSLSNNRRKPLSSKPPVKYFSKPQTHLKINKSEPNFSTQTAKSYSYSHPKHCRFCGVDGHNSVDCNNYVSYKFRIDKCNDLLLYTLCTSPNHKAYNCPGSEH